MAFLENILGDMRHAGANLRAVLEHVTIADVARGELPATVEELAANPDAWQPR
jgi:hypothetical protein